MARFLALILSALLPGVAFAVACPVEERVHPGVVVPGWPTTKSPGATWTPTGSTDRCGYNSSSVSMSGSGMTYAAAMAVVYAALDAKRVWTTVAGVPVASCYTQRNSSVYAVSVVYKFTHPTNGSVVYYSGEAYTSVTTAPCEPPTSTATCEADAWIHTEVAADTADAAEGSIAAGDCMEGCKVKGVQLWSPGINLGSGVRWSLGVQITGEVCGGVTGTPSPQEPEGPDDKELCKATPGSGTACAGPYGENCGYLNGKFVCLGKTDPDECWINDDGSRWCGESAPMPPAPDNGTRGEKATPNDQVEQEAPNGTTTTYNYYNTTTMAGSSQASDSGANPNRPGSSNPGTEPTPVSCEGDNCGGEDGGGSETGGAAWCDAPPTCSDGTSIYCAQLQQQWRSMCPQMVTDDEALAAIGATEEEINGVAPGDATDIGALDATGPLGAAACPAPINVTVMGQSLSLDIWQRGCDMALLFAPFVMAMGYLMAGLLFVRGLS